jgi:branched-chain amino acid transport system substrate-binding protein
MISRFPLITAVILVALLHTSEGWARYSIGLALPSSEKGTRSRFVGQIEGALRVFQEQLRGEVGRELAQEFGVEPPEIVFVTKECPPKDAECAVETAKKFVDSDCVAVVGHTYSGPALAAGKVYDRHKMVMITPTATHREIARVSNRVFRLTFDDQWQGAVIAAYVLKMMERAKIAVLYERSAYGLGLLESFKKQAHSLGFQPVAEIEVHTALDGKITGEPEGLAATLASADAVVLFTGKDAGLALFSLIRANSPQIPIIGSDNLLWSSFARDIDREVHRLGLKEAHLLVASPFFYELAPLKAHEFKRLYERRFAGAESSSALAHGSEKESGMGLAPFPALFVDAAMLVTRGIMAGLAKNKRSAAELRQEIFDYLNTLDSPSSAVDGITGQLYFDKEGNIPRPVLFAWLKGGRFRPAYLQLTRARGRNGKECSETSGSVDGSIVVNGVSLRPRNVVYTGINLYRIDNVNLLRQTFDAEFFLWFKWRKPDTLNLDDHTIFFWNSLHTADDQIVPLAANLCEDTKYRGFRIKGTFLDVYNLKDYPFDSQFLNLRMSLSAYGADRILLAVDDEVDVAADQFHIFPNEYDHLEKPEHFSGTLPLNASFGDPFRKTAEGVDYQYSVYQVRFGVTRNPFPYLLKMFLPLFVLIAISLAVFWVPVEHFAVRITVVMTSLLSTIVFHMSKSTGLPNVGYLTLADKFFVCAYMIMSISIVAHIWIEWSIKRGPEGRSEALNSGARYVLTAASVIVFLTLALPVMEGWYARTLAFAGLVFGLWLLYECVRHYPDRFARLKSFLLPRGSDSR